MLKKKQLEKQRLTIVHQSGSGSAEEHSTNFRKRVTISNMAECSTSSNNNNNIDYWHTTLKYLPEITLQFVESYVGSRISDPNNRGYFLFTEDYVFDVKGTFLLLLFVS